MAYNVGEIYEIFDKLDIESKRKVLKDLQSTMSKCIINDVRFGYEENIRLW